MPIKAKLLLLLIYVIKDSEKRDMSGEEPFQVTIFTHESGRPPLEQTIVSAQERVCANHTGIQASAEIRGHVSSVSWYREKQRRPFAGLVFRCERNYITELETTQTVWTRPPANLQQPVTLHEIVGGGVCRLAIVLACCGDELIEDYLKAMGTNNFPDMLICNTNEIHSDTAEILTVLLINMINILDSNMVSHAPGPEMVYTSVRAAIVKVFQILKLFEGYHMQFWSFLQNVGCISDIRLQKQRQQLEYRRRLPNDDIPRFRTAASVNTRNEYNLVDNIGWIGVVLIR